MIVIKHRACPDLILLRVEGVNLDERNLAGAYLPGALLTGKRCRGAIFRGANLRKADLRGADLQGADFSSAKLSGADLSGAKLAGAILLDADLCEANLKHADLSGANLSGAILSLTDLTDVLSDRRTQWPAGLETRPVATPGRIQSPWLALSLQGQRASAEWASWRASLATRHRRLTPTQRHHPAPWLSDANRNGVRISLAAVAAAFSFLAFVGVMELARDQDLHTSGMTAPSRVTVNQEQEAERLPAKPETSRRPLVKQASSLRVAQRPRRRRSIVRPTAHRQLAKHSELTVRRGRKVTHRNHRNRLVAQAAPAVEPRASRAGSRSESRTARIVPAAYHPPVKERFVARVTPPEAPRVEAPRPEPRRNREREAPVTTSRSVRYAFGNSGFHYGSGYDIYRMHIGADSSRDAVERRED